MLPAVHTNLKSSLTSALSRSDLPLFLSRLACAPSIACAIVRSLLSVPSTAYVVFDESGKIFLRWVNASPHSFDRPLPPPESAPCTRTTVATIEYVSGGGE